MVVIALRWTQILFAISVTMAPFGLWAEQGESPPALTGDASEADSSSTAENADKEASSTPWLRLHHQTIIAGRYNPPGLITVGRLQLDMRLYRADSIVLRENYVGLALVPKITPAFAGVGVSAILQPLTILRLRAEYMPIRYFGAFDYLQSFPTPNDDFSDATLKERAEDERHYATSGSMTTFDVQLRAKVGAIGVQNLFKATRVNMDLEGGDEVYYDGLFNVLLPAQGWVVANDLDVVWLTDWGLVAGIRYNVVETFYDESLLRGEKNRNTPMHRLGPLVKYAFFESEGSALSKAEALLLVNWWIKHRYRAGQETSQAVPMVALGVILSGDLLSDTDSAAGNE